MDNNGFVKDTPWQTNGDSGLHEECGVFGMYDFDGGDVASFCIAAPWTGELWYCGQ